MTGKMIDDRKTSWTFNEIRPFVRSIHFDGDWD